MRGMSLRARATVLATCVIAVLLTAGAVLLVSTLESRLTQATDQLSRSRVDDLLALARTDDLPRTIPNVDDNGVSQVVGPDGSVVASSPNIAGRPAIAELPAGAEQRTSTFRAPDDSETETYRFWYASGPGPDGAVTVYVGNSLESVTEASAALRHSLWVGVPVAVALLGVLIWVVLGRALGRLDRIRAEVDRISEENLHTRVAGDGIDDEVGRLAATMNAMLERLDRAAQRQRDFVADVSHDLQGPLAAQRVAVEVALAHPDAIDVERLRDEVLGATTDMEHLVGDLLVVASLDADTASTPALLDLDSLVLEEATRARTSGRVAVDTSSVSAAPAFANPDDVRRVVRNVLDNAITHAATAVTVSVDTHDTWARLTIHDDGPGVAPADRDRVFDRFFRAEAARSRGRGDGGGSGLGLPIARGLAEHNGGRLDILDTAGTTMQLLLPLAP